MPHPVPRSAKADRGPVGDAGRTTNVASPLVGGVLQNAPQMNRDAAGGVMMFNRLVMWSPPPQEMGHPSVRSALADK